MSEKEYIASKISEAGTKSIDLHDLQRTMKLEGKY